MSYSLLVQNIQKSRESNNRTDRQDDDDQMLNICGKTQGKNIYDDMIMMIMMMVKPDVLMLIICAKNWLLNAQLTVYFLFSND